MFWNKSNISLISLLTSRIKHSEREYWLHIYIALTYFLIFIRTLEISEVLFSPFLHMSNPVRPSTWPSPSLSGMFHDSSNLCPNFDVLLNNLGLVVGELWSRLNIYHTALHHLEINIEQMTGDNYKVCFAQLADVKDLWTKTLKGKES